MAKAKKKRTAKKAPKNTKPAPQVDPDRAEAAAEVLQTVFLHEKNFDLESVILLKDGKPVAVEDKEGYLWLTVRLHVPALDIDTWLDGTHMDHPNNQPEADEDDA